MKPPSNPAKSQEYSLVAECLYRSNSSGVYYALFKRGGKQIRRSLKTIDRRHAERLLMQMREKVNGLQPNREKAYMTFGELADMWFASWKGHLKESSSNRRALVIRQLSEAFAGVQVRNLTRAMCEAWANTRGLDVAPVTFNLDRDTLSMVLEYARREGIIMDNPAKDLIRRRPQKKAILIPSRADFTLLVESMRKMNEHFQRAADLVELLAYSGMRKSEANAFAFADVDFERGNFTVTGGETGTKNLEARVVPLFPALRDLVLKIRERHRRHAQSPLVDVLDVKKALATVCRLHHLPHYSHHCFRHYFVSNAIEKGVDFKTVASWVGHKDGGMLVAKTYGHLRDSHSFEMAKRMTA